MTSTAPQRPPRRFPVPLPLTSAVMVLLVVVPALQISRWPRPKAQGLEQLMASASLLQSFQATPERRLPELWRDRLGPDLGQRLWRLQRRSWWQFWGPHADGLPYLALPEPGSSLRALTYGIPGAGRRLQERALRVGDLLVLAPDPLSRQLLRDRLRPRQRPSRGLQRQCLERLERDQAVFWNPTALGAMLGPLAPLFQRYQEGCLSLELGSGSRLRWQGGSVGIQGLSLRPPRLSSTLSELPPLPPDLLLELTGSSLQPLVQGLIQRDLIREPLTSRYGLEANRLERLSRAPFRLRLRALPQGPFRAAVELQLRLEGNQQVWKPVLERISESLLEQGWRRPGDPVPQAEAGQEAPAPAAAGEPAAGAPAPALTPPTPGVVPSPGSATGMPAPAALARDPGLTLWVRDGGEVVGGWRWLGSNRTHSQVVLFLGPPPVRSAWQPLQPVARGSSLVQLRLRPQAMGEQGLLPQPLPLPVQRASQLQIQSLGLRGNGPEAQFSLLTGQLQVERRR